MEPIKAFWDADTNLRSIYGIASFNDIITRMFGINATAEEMEAYNREVALLNAAAAVGPEEFRRIFAHALDLNEVEQIIEVAGSQITETAGTSEDQKPSSHRWSSITRSTTCRTFR